MTTDEAKEACRSGGIVIYNGGEYTVGHINTFWSKSDRAFRNSLSLIPCNGADSVTVARIREVEVKYEGRKI